MPALFYFDRHTGCWQCTPCNRSFSRRGALDQHLSMSDMHAYCTNCERDFVSNEARRQHWIDSPAHSFCLDCDEHFDDKRGLERHECDCQVECDRCGNSFWSENILKAHKATMHFYCIHCDRHFNNQHSLETHLKSSVHQPRNINCPLQGCAGAFLTPAGLVQHWESGDCKGNATRALIDRFAIENDVGRTFTHDHRTITLGAASDYPWTPAISYSATSLAWNGKAYECYLCHIAFEELNRLNQHLSSPRHSGSHNPIYHCPPGGCGSEFTTCSGLVQHIECGSCGVLRYRFVQNAIGGVLSGVQMLTM